MLFEKETVKLGNSRGNKRIDHLAKSFGSVCIYPFASWTMQFGGLVRPTFVGLLFEIDEIMAELISSVKFNRDARYEAK